MSRLLRWKSLTLSALLFTVSLEAAAAQAAPAPCSSRFSFLAFEGKRVENIADADRSADIYHLGSGIAGGDVYRVVPRDKRLPSYVRKDYFVESGLVNDLRALAQLRALPPDAFPIRIVRTLKEFPEKKRLHIEDVPGRTLNDVLLDPALPASLRESLKNRYLDAIARLEQAIAKLPGASRPNQRDFRDLKGMPRALLFSITRNDGRGTSRIDIMLKSDNIIVDPETFELTLIDPF